MKKFKALHWLFSINVYFILIVSLAVQLLPAGLKAQENKGLPFITNYRYQDYNAGGVNWWAAEDNKGVMYFANGQGVLVYDGQQWETVVPPGNSETRSLVKGNDGKIYVGTNGDIGYIGQGKKGRLEYISLKNKIPENHRKFNEVWETQNFNGDIFFRATNKMFRWNGTAMKVYESKEGFHVGDVVNNQYYVRIWGRGLTILKEDSLHVVPNGEKFANERIYAYIPYDKGRMLIGTRTQGLFIYDGKDFTPFKTEADAYLVNKSLYGGIRLSNGNFAFNNFNDGIVIIDKQGKLVQVIDKTVGLMDNAADYVFEDSRGILWIPLFNGIAKFDLHSSLTYYNETMGLPGKAVFNIGIINDTVYAGTNTGVYMLNKNINRFEKLAGSSGQIGNFILNGNDLLVAAADNG
ncbi:MAG TPA: hypothetical protein VI548_11310, partial [Chitinophagaceae bacterium]|nr:hypothetical protein [Chitinophagaceae bacterium]